MVQLSLGVRLAVTHGHGNPNWNRDETILALEPYFALSGKNPSAKDPQLIALSQTLRGHCQFFRWFPAIAIRSRQHRLMAWTISVRRMRQAQRGRR